jgi:hypothetical protein
MQKILWCLIALAACPRPEGSSIAPDAPGPARKSARDAPAPHTPADPPAPAAPPTPAADPRAAAWPPPGAPPLPPAPAPPASGDLRDWVRARQRFTVQADTSPLRAVDLALLPAALARAPGWRLTAEADAWVAHRRGDAPGGAAAGFGGWNPGTTGRWRESLHLGATLPTPPAAPQPAGPGAFRVEAWPEDIGNPQSPQAAALVVDAPGLRLVLEERGPAIGLERVAEALSRLPPDLAALRHAPAPTPPPGPPPLRVRRVDDGLDAVATVAPPALGWTWWEWVGPAGGAWQAPLVAGATLEAAAPPSTRLQSRIPTAEEPPEGAMLRIWWAPWEGGAPVVLYAGPAPAVERPMR